MSQYGAELAHALCVASAPRAAARSFARVSAPNAAWLAMATSAKHESTPKETAASRAQSGYAPASAAGLGSSAAGSSASGADAGASAAPYFCRAKPW